MRFLRHRGIYQSDVGFLMARYARCKTRSGVPPPDYEQASRRSCPWPRSPSALKSHNPRARTKLKDAQEEHALAIIVSMSSGRLILDRVARQQCPSPLHRSCSEYSIAGLSERIYHRTVVMP